MTIAPPELKPLVVGVSGVPDNLGTVSRPIGFFEQSGPVKLILWAFPCVCLPVAGLIVAQGYQSVIVWLYMWLFGMTHFVLTLTIYLQSANLRHFASSRRNQLIFFFVPAMILVSFDVLHAVRFGATFPIGAMILTATIRLFDFVHFNRQSFGVLQLFKGRTRIKPQPALKQIENAFFFTLVANMYLAFLAGGSSPLVRSWIPSPLPPLVSDAVMFWPAVLLALVAVVLFVAVLTRHRRDYRGQPVAGMTVLYLVLQTVSAVMTTVWFPLYAAALALHYVEYHVLMHPRVFALPLDERSRIDRFFSRLRSRPAGFYAVLAGVSFLATAGMFLGMGLMGAAPTSLDQPTIALVALAIFDGLFVFHYFVEMFIWKFSDSHFRQTLSSLYFSK